MNRIATIILVFLLLYTGADAQNVKRTRTGLIIVNTDSVVRAMEPYGGCADDGVAYAKAINDFKRQYSKARFYCMIIPNAVALYCPDSVSHWTKDEQSAINGFYAHLTDGVKDIQLIDTLKAHATENIYLRTDHHWAPLGAYYAARTFAQVAGVPFKALSEYEKRVVRDFVGTMYKFTQEEAIREHPEDFIYYVPKNMSYVTEQVKYQHRTIRRKRKRYKVLTAKPKEQVEFFREYDDGSAAAYSTFMGGDLNTTSVKTSTKNGRRLLILKDSYGNALPPFLFGSFEEIHVVDCRYFLGNIIQYAKAHHISDVLFANNLIHASSPVISQNYKRYISK